MILYVSYCNTAVNQKAFTHQLSSGAPLDLYETCLINYVELRVSSRKCQGYSRTDYGDHVGFNCLWLF